jgi:hypothetical protein
VESIFSNVSLIWNFNNTLLQELEKQFALNEEAPHLGQVFLEMVPSPTLCGTLPLLTAPC